MRVFLRVISLLVPVLLFAACDGGGGSSEGTAVTVSDSAGTRIVSNALSAPRDTVAVQMLWEYGAGSEEYAFQFVSHGVVRGVGDIVVVDGGNQEVVVIDADGGGHRVLAGSGQGPGEVAFPRRIVATGPDGLWIEDLVNGRLLLLNGDSVSETVSGSANPSLSQGLMPIGTTSDGRLMLRTGQYRSDFDEPWLDGALAVFDPSTSRTDTVASFPLARRRPEPPASPFGPSGAVSAAGRSFVTARTDRAEVVWRDAAGTVQQIARWSSTPRFPDEADWEAFRAARAANLERVNPQRSGADLEALIEDALADYTLDESAPLPFFDDVIGAESGAVWLEPYVTDGSSASRYVVLSPEGQWLGVAQFPQPVRILHVGANTIVGVHTGEFDVQTVAAYRNPFAG